MATLFRLRATQMKNTAIKISVKLSALSPRDFSHFSNGRKIGHVACSIFIADTAQYKTVLDLSLYA